MKISGADIAFSSDGHFEQMDVSVKEKTEQRLVRQNQNRREEPVDLSRIVVDRISISQKTSADINYNYSADISGRSSVTSEVSGETIVYAQQSAIQQLVGAVIDQDVRNLSVIPVSQEQPVNAAESERRTMPGWQSEIRQMTLNKTDIHFEAETATFLSTGEVLTEDGRRIDFSLDMSLNRAFLSRTQEETLIQSWQERIQLTDPLVISLDGKAPALSNTRFEFDLDADGDLENISFASAGSGFLAFDKNGDTRINDGSELFGPGTGNGFEELAAYDEDQNQWIDENDAVFSKLSVWTKDERGRDVLVSLKESGIGAISLGYAQTRFNMTQADNALQGQMKHTGLFLFEDGKVGSLHQVDLAARPKEIPALDPPDNLLKMPATGPETNLTPGAADLTETEDAVNPLQALLDRIKQLKEEMGRLYEKMGPGYGKRQFGRSRYSNYREMNMRSSDLWPGNPTGPVRKDRGWV